MAFSKGQCPTIACAEMEAPDVALLPLSWSDWMEVDTCVRAAYPGLFHDLL